MYTAVAFIARSARNNYYFFSNVAAFCNYSTDLPTARTAVYLGCSIADGSSNGGPVPNTPCERIKYWRVNFRVKRKRK